MKKASALAAVAFVIYDFRHTFATLKAESGMPIAILAKILGHKDLRSVMKYVHVGQEAQDRAMTESGQSTSRISTEAAEPTTAPVKTIRKSAAREVSSRREKERVN